jgi:DNA-directed RNA polymerase specialized sigma24 family protein
VSQEQAEFAGFFESSWGPCLRAVLAVAGSPQQAGDQVAGAFARAWRAWRRVSCHPAPRAWVVRTALSTGTTWWRRRAREVPLADCGAMVPGGQDGGLDAAVLAALRSLPRRQREVIALRVFLDMDTGEIAAQLGIAPATVRVHLARATAALRQELSPPKTQEVGQ